VNTEAKQQNVVFEVISDERIAERGLNTINQGVAQPDRLLSDLIELIEADGYMIPATPRLKGWARRIQKAIEEGQDVR
jgi:hypothetical protein